MSAVVSAILEPLLTAEDVAALLSVPVTAVNDWRSRGVGIAHVKIGKFVRYHPEDVRKFVNANRQQPSVQAALEATYGR
jgi:hypothetical protein